MKKIKREKGSIASSKMLLLASLIVAVNEKVNFNKEKCLQTRVTEHYLREGTK